MFEPFLLPGSRLDGRGTSPQPFFSPRLKPGGSGSSPQPFFPPLSHTGGVLPRSQPCRCPVLIQPGGSPPWGAPCGDADSASCCPPPPPPSPPGPFASAIDPEKSRMAAHPAAKNAALVIASIPDLNGNGILSL